MKDYLKGSLIYLIMLTAIFIPIGSIAIYLGYLDIMGVIICYGLSYLAIHFAMILGLILSPLFDKIADL